MSDINKVVIVGRVVEKPTVKHLPNADNTAVADMRIANNVYRGQGKDPKVNWLTVTVFGKRAESCAKNLEKGSQIGVEGKLDFQQWEKDGNKRSMVKIIADQVQFLGKKKTSDQPVETQPDKGDDPLRFDPDE